MWEKIVAGNKRADELAKIGNKLQKLKEPCSELDNTIYLEKCEDKKQASVITEIKQNFQINRLEEKCIPRLDL